MSKGKVRQAIMIGTEIMEKVRQAKRDYEHKENLEVSLREFMERLIRKGLDKK